MNSTADPFPSSLPLLNSPPDFDTDMVGSIQGGELYFNSALPNDSPGQFISDGVSPFPSPASMNVRITSTNVMATKTANNQSCSPDSSPQDSSSDSSGRHKRKTSSKSSFSNLAGRELVMTDAPANGWKREHSREWPVEGTYDFSSTNPAEYIVQDMSNRQMENDFDFDSAASSPSPALNASTPMHTSNRHIAIPYRASPRSAASLVAQSRSSMGTREISPLSAMAQSGFLPPAMQHTETSPASSSEDYIGGAMVNGMQQLSTWPSDGQPMIHRFSHGLPMNNYQPNIASGPVISPSMLGYQQNASAMPPALCIHPTPHKSRVETQIPIKMTLFPMPPGIKKLHLPAHTISKPKLLAKPPPTTTPDTLELYTMLVCTSAMQDPLKMRRAFARAARGSREVKRPETRRSSSGDVATLNEEDQPLNGGPVHICEGCILRERKRAARKKSKKPEEEEPWQRDEAKRIIVFNTSEVKEWQSPSEAKIDAETNEPVAQNNAALPDNARQIDVPMRIACYCRHQNEKLGFQVIFTIKDFEDNLVAQAITSSIVITDDHKTHAPILTQPAPGTMFSDHPAFPNGLTFGSQSLENYNHPLYRNAHSTTDLQNLQQNFQPQFMSQTISPFAIPQNLSQTTSANPTPRNISRQASPSAQPGPVPKKRKSSGSSKIPDGLTMTRLQTSSGPNATNQSWAPSAVSNPVSPTGGMPYTQGYQSMNNAPERSYGPLSASRPTQPHTGPPTPNGNDAAFFSTANRTQSLENLSAVQQMFSAPNSARPSRAPSPTSINHMPNGIPAAHVPALVNTAMNFPSAMAPQRPPTIHKLIPNEGSKAGGIEITCLGSGFYQGLEVMFGDALATTTTYWGETSLVCLLPPALRAGTVAVTFKHQHQQQLQHARYSTPPIPKQQVFFKYVDDDEQELVRHALLLVHQKMTGTIEDVGEIARRIVNSQPHNTGSWSRGTSQGGDQMRQAPSLQACLPGAVDVEVAVLNCLDLMDLDDSPFHPPYNLRRPNGQSMLHLGASLGYHRLVCALLARGAEPDLRDRNGMSPMHMAALHGHSHIIRRLRLAGADSSLRSLRGFTPADMATSQSALDAVQTLQIHSRSRSAGASTVSLISRASSTTSLRSLLSLGDASLDSSDDEDIYDTAVVETLVPRHHKVSELWASSRRNSSSMDRNARPQSTMQQPLENVAALSPAAAMAAWRDQITAQIQHFQQSVQWTLPNLQIPTLPPMPYLPEYPFRSLVPQRGFRSISSLQDVPEARDGDYRWWELLTGPTPAPPSYDEIYPGKVRHELDIKKASATRAAADAIADQKCSASFDSLPKTSILESTSIKEVLSTQQQEQLRDAHARKVKRLRSDRNLFFIWIPLLVIVVLAMLNDRIPQIWNGAQSAVAFVRSRYQPRVVEIL